MERTDQSRGNAPRLTSDDIRHNPPVLWREFERALHDNPNVLMAETRTVRVSVAEAAWILLGGKIALVAAWLSSPRRGVRMVASVVGLRRPARIGEGA